MKTYSVKAKEIEEQWHFVDASEQPLGRMAARVASLLRGKHRANFSPHLDMRDFVVVVNAGKLQVKGTNKMRQKTYYRHSQYPGGFKEVTLEKMMSTHPERVIEHAVKGMLPHNRLGAQLRRHLKVYVGPDHPHGAQLATGARPFVKKVVAPKPEPAPEPVVEETVPEVVAAVEEQAPVSADEQAQEE